MVDGDTRTNSEALVLSTMDKKMEQGEEYMIPITAKNFEDLSGYQFTLKVDQNLIEFVDIKVGNLDGLAIDNFGFSKLNDGIITTSWNDRIGVSMNPEEVLFYLVVKAKSETKLSEAISINSLYTKSEAYSVGLDLKEVVLEFEGDNLENTTPVFALYQNQPNPFKEETMIGFTLPRATEAKLTIYDVTGRVLKQIKGNFDKGYNTVGINRSELDGSSVMFYRLEISDNIAVKEMIILN